MQTPARRRASNRFHDKLKAEGMKKTTVWLSPDAREALALLKQWHGSQDRAVIAVLVCAARQIMDQRVSEGVALGGEKRSDAIATRPSGPSEELTKCT